MNRIILIIMLLAGGYLTAAFLLYLFQEQLIFLGESIEEDYQFTFENPFQEITIETKDHGKINIIHFTLEKPKGIILYYHGNAGSLIRWGQVAESFLPLGYEVAIMDYRGFGKSTGPRSQKILLNDAQSFYDYFKKDYPESEIILFGRSLGTGIASWIASNNKPSQIILETPYYSLTSLVQSKFPVFPAGPSLRYKFRTFQYLKESECPITIFHGTADKVVPFRHGKRLYESLDKSKAEFVKIDEGNHANLSEYQLYWDKMKDILK